MNRMIPNSIASEPTLGWKKNNINQSKEAIEWLTWCQQHQAPHIQHGKNAGEYRIPGTKLHVDGFDVTTHTIYEFHSCFWHGCPRHYPNRHEKHLRHCDRTMQDVYEATQQRTQMLRAQGYTVVEMWGCDWASLKDTSLDIRTFVANPSKHKTPESTRRFLWRTYQCGEIVPSSDPPPKDPLHRCHLLVPLGQQNLCLP